MGYTHYFSQQKHPAPDQWQAIKEGFAALSAAATNAGQPFPIQREDDNAAEPEIGDDRITFNGAGDDGHETMLLEREGYGFQFCKTARKPYDRAVMALLILADQCAPGCWEIGSDGDPEDWQPTLDWMNSLQIPGLELPVGVARESSEDQS